MKKSAGMAILESLSVDARRYEALALMTRAIVRQAEVDDQIDLRAAFAKNKHGMKVLNDRLRIAIGISEEKKVNGKPRVVLTRAASEFFPIGMEDRASEEFRRKETFRGNFANMLKRAAQAAAGIRLMEAEVEWDSSKGGTLALSGPKVARHFGTERIVLDEAKREGQLEKPSYTAVAAIAAEKFDVVMARGSNTRGVRSADMTGDKQVESACSSLIEAINAITGRPTARQKGALAAARSAIRRTIG